MRYFNLSDFNRLKKMKKELVTSLELSKELKELGCEQESEFSWFYYKPYHIKNEFGERDVSEDYKVLPTNSDFYDLPKRVASALLSGELGEMLPKQIDDFWLCCIKAIDHWIISYRDYEDNNKSLSQAVVTSIYEAEARGKMLLYLIENKLYDPKTNKK